MKKNPHITLLLLAALLFLSASCGREKTAEPAPAALDTIPVLVSDVRQCSRLYTSEYRIHKIVTHSDQMKLEGTVMRHSFSVNLPVGERRIAIPMTAVLKAYVDLGGFSEDNVRRQGRKITILLPDPRFVLTATKIDHKGVRQYVALTRRNFSDAELTGYGRQGREQIIGSIPQMNLIETARASAARQIVPLVKALGYREEDITVTFRRKFSLNDIRCLIDNQTIEKRYEEDVQ